MTTKEMSEVFREELRKRDWSVSDLARAADMNYETVRRAVKKIGFASLENANKLLACFGRDLVVEGEEEQPA